MDNRVRIVEAATPALKALVGALIVWIQVAAFVVTGLGALLSGIHAAATANWDWPVYAWSVSYGLVYVWIRVSERGDTSPLHKEA